ncbi:hypothetical protein ACQ4LE_003150 [Meloidogyne hapla]
MKLFQIFTFVSFLFLITPILSSPEDPSLTFEHFYQFGKNEYTTGNWADCVAFMLKAIEDFLYYREEVLWCRRMCRERYGVDLTNIKDLIKELDPTLLFIQYESNQALCLLKCRLDKFTDQRPPLNNPNKLFKEFRRREPFHYLQFCYWKLGQLKQAVKSAFTFLVVNPGDEDTLNNLHFYMEQPGFEREMLIDDWQYQHEKLYMKAVNAYDKQEWLNCVNLFQESLQQFWEALEDCRSECEYLNKNEEIDVGEEQNEWSVFITKSYLSVLQCRQSCVSQLSFLNGRYTKHFLLSHFEHLHLCQFNLKHGRDACQSVENALLLQPKNIIMRRNKLFYLNSFTGNVVNDVNLFQPSKEIKHFIRREEVERHFLEFMEKELNQESLLSSSPKLQFPQIFDDNLIDQFNYSKILETKLISQSECLFLRSAADFFPKYFPFFQQLLIKEFLNRISKLYEIEEELPIFEGIYCVPKGLFGKSNCERPTFSISINNINCGQIGGGEFTGCVIVFCEL